MKEKSLFGMLPKRSKLGLGLMVSEKAKYHRSTPQKRFDFPKGKGMQTYSAIYVPSTQDVNKKITPREHEKRVDDVRRFMTTKFGGTTTVKGVGSYTSKKGQVVKENVAIVENYSDYKDWKASDQDVENFVQSRAKKWGQESISVEFAAPHKTHRIIFVEKEKGE